MRTRRAASVLCLLAAVSACTDDPTPSSSAPPSTTTSTTTSTATAATSTAAMSSPSSAATKAPRVASTSATGLTSPWGLAFLSDGDALVSERDTGHIHRATASGETFDLGAVPGIDAGGEGGLLGLAVQGADVYAYLTAASDNRIVRMTLTGNALSAPVAVLTGIPKAAIHNGGRLVFGPDGMLYAGTGDAADRPASQDRDSLGGKILRIKPDGSVPADNPFPGSYVWSYGHRNVQGLAFDPSGRLWASEFGQNTWDELNLIRKGGNYGWPNAEGRNSNDSSFIAPVAQWPTSEASPSGLAYWNGSLWMAGLRGARLWQIPVDGESAATPVAHFSGTYGRLRTVTVAPDGRLWLMTSNTDGRGDPRSGDDRILILAA